MNREVNKGVELNKQTQMLPVPDLRQMSASGRAARDGLLLGFLADELGVAKEDILDFERRYSAGRSQRVSDWQTISFPVPGLTI